MRSKTWTLEQSLAEAATITERYHSRGIKKYGAAGWAAREESRIASEHREMEERLARAFPLVRKAA